MKEKPLHEKKVSEVLIQETYPGIYDASEVHALRRMDYHKLRNWAISVIREYYRFHKQKIEFDKKGRLLYDGTHFSHIDLGVVAFLMDSFEIVEEDIK